MSDDGPRPSAQRRKATPLGRRPAPLFALFFVSGFAALVYQVLWVRELGLLFGSTAQAAAMAIAIFFAGITVGGWFWGPRSARLSSGLRGFGLLEIGVAASALGHFVLIDAYHALYPAVYTAIGSTPALDTAAKAGVAAVILFPPAFLMGGTLPMMGQHLVRHRGRLATTGTTLYAVNTAGSALGALAAAFVLPVALGFRGTYLLAVVLDLVVGLAAVALAGPAARAAVDPRRSPAVDLLARGVSTVTRRGPTVPTPPLRPAVVWLAAAASGFATLAVEVIWTRLFAQVLQNSVYTYATVLTTFLVALCLGAGAANLLSRVRRVRPELVVGGLLLASSAAVATSPWLFFAATDGLAYVGSDLGWNAYVAAVATVAMLVMLVPGTVLGTLLPYLLRVLQEHDRAPGDAIGRLVAANTGGAILGSLTAGFVLLPTIGAWRGLLALGAIYPALLAVVALQRVTARRAGVAGLATASVVALVLVTPAGLDSIRLRGDSGEELVEIREGSQAHVAVVERHGSRSIRVNNHYTLGSSGARHSERNQTVIPMLTHPEPRSVFFLGMGTGITAGAALAFPVERVVVCELVGDVIAVADAHFRPWTNGLFEDGRVEIHAEDGRNCLRRSPERYDVIISDLFTPWKAGTGSLYTAEHYATARERLEPGGIFAQWVPLYQVSEAELGTIARTMDDVFDQVVMWRGDLFAARSIVALVGQVEAAPLDPQAVLANARALSDDPQARDEELEALALRMYVGNVTASGRFTHHPPNTDTRPVVEYLAPRTHREARIGRARFLVGAEREQLYDELLSAVPPERDPYLTRLGPRRRAHVHAGRSYSRYAWASSRGSAGALAEVAYDDFLARSPEGTHDALSPSRDLRAWTTTTRTSR